jgi:glycosyltransferase involved in cell wall biosynthesis
VITGPPDPHDQGDIEYYHHLLDIRRDLDVEEEVRFVYGSGPEEMEGYIIGPGMVGELYHVCDALFMPSHREGFGMPILEAGLLGRPVFSTQIPAALEVGDGEVYTFESGASPEAVARLITQWADASRTHKLRVRVRRDYTWQAIFDRHILPLLTQGYSP